MDVSERLQENDDPLDVLAGCRQRVWQVCGDLEALADQLGARALAPYSCRSVLKRLKTDLSLCHRNEELLYKLMMRRSTESSAISRCIEVAIDEHARAETCTLELAEPLSEAGEGLLNWNANAFGYLMRHCFETITRHLEWEDAAIFREPQLELSPMDERVLREGFRRNLQMIEHDAA